MGNLNRQLYVSPADRHAGFTLVDLGREVGYSFPSPTCVLTGRSDSHHAHPQQCVSVVIQCQTHPNPGFCETAAAGSERAWGACSASPNFLHRREPWQDGPLRLPLATWRKDGPVRWLFHASVLRRSVSG